MSQRRNILAIAACIGICYIPMQAELQAKNYEITSLKKELKKYKEDNSVISSSGNSMKKYVRQLEIAIKIL